MNIINTIIGCHYSVLVGVPKINKLIIPLFLRFIIIIIIIGRCVWPETEVGSGVRHTHTEPLQSSVLHKLRDSITKPCPVLRPRIR